VRATSHEGQRVACRPPLPPAGVGSQRLAARESLAKLYAVLGDTEAEAEQRAEAAVVGAQIAAKAEMEAKEKKEKEDKEKADT